MQEITLTACELHERLRAARAHGCYLGRQGRARAFAVALSVGFAFGVGLVRVLS